MNAGRLNPAISAALSLVLADSRLRIPLDGGSDAHFATSSCFYLLSVRLSCVRSVSLRTFERPHAGSCFE